MIWKYLQVGGVVLVLVLLASIVFAWKASQVEQAQLQAELKAAQQLLADANERCQRLGQACSDGFGSQTSLADDDVVRWDRPGILDYSERPARNLDVLV